MRITCRLVFHSAQLKDIEILSMLSSTGERFSIGLFPTCTELPLTDAYAYTDVSTNTEMCKHVGLCEVCPYVKKSLPGHRSSIVSQSLLAAEGRHRLARPCTCLALPHRSSLSTFSDCLLPLSAGCRHLSFTLSLSRRGVRAVIACRALQPPPFLCPR